jgi:hypothetical protein
MPEGTEPAGQVQSWDTNTMPWEIRHIDELDGDLAAKPLITDPDTPRGWRWSTARPRTTT